MTISLLPGDCLDVLRTMPDCSIDAVVTDPPYGLSFMGKKWDYDVPTVEVWREVFRVLKPGGHLLAFAGTRTQHRMCVNIEDAGFEIRDMIAWVYGSGFPKSLDVSKAITAYETTGGSQPKNLRQTRMGNDYKPTNQSDYRKGRAFSSEIENDYRETTLTEAAKQWEGWGTALKPALEPITVARKPLDGTVAENVLRHGTGAINVDGCRVATDWTTDPTRRGWQGGDASNTKCNVNYGNANGPRVSHPNNLGRWPANLIHDGSDEVVELFPRNVKGQAGMSKTQGGYRFIEGDTKTVQKFDYGSSDTGSAARFFYCAKASKRERGEGNNHPTVKPIALMRYICRLVTPPGGIILDPFMGSGSTGIAALQEGFGFIGIEREIEYMAIAQRRIEEAETVMEDSDNLCD